MKDTIQKNGTPAYLQLYDRLRADIVAGVYPYRAKLPSKRTVAAELHLSTVTVEHAYALLIDEGYLEARERSGYFVCFRKADGFSAAPRTLPHITAPAHPAVSAQFPISVLTKAMRRVISTLGAEILERSPNGGCTALREALCQYLARSRGIHAVPEQLIIGAGSEYLYGLIVALFGREKTYAIESPSYHKIERIYRAADVHLEQLPLAADGIDSAALRASRADVLHISPYRSYPTGVTASASKRHEYLHWASQGRFLIEDDYESEFSVLKKPEATLFTNEGNVIYMNSFSMTISPSLRAGYMVLPRRLVPVFTEKLGFYACPVPTFEQYVLAELLLSGDFERHVNRVRRKKRKGEL